MPYNPGIADISGQLMGQGFARAGEGIARGLERYADAQLEAKRQAALATGLRKIAPLLRNPDGTELISKEEAAGMSGQELGSLLQNYAVQTQIAMTQQQMELGRENLKRFAKQEKAQEAFNRELAQKLEGMPSLTLPPAVPMPTLPDLAGQLASPELPGDTPPLTNYLPRTVTPAVPPQLPGGAEILGMAARHGMATPEMLASMQPDPIKQINAETALQNAQTAQMNAQTARMRVEQTAQGKETAQNHPWLFSDDTDQLAKGLQELDPQERDRVIAVRTAYNRMLGRTDPFMEALVDAITGRKREPEEKETAAQKVRKYNPDTGRIE